MTVEKNVIYGIKNKKEYRDKSKRKELLDYADYIMETFQITHLKKRYPAMAVIVSGLVGSAVDSAIFLSLAFGSVQYLFGQVLGKFWVNLLAGIAIAWWRRRKQAEMAICA